MKVYLVGGAVRDKLLGRKVYDRDWVVVGSSPKELLAKKFIPVGKDFSVFLHPVTKEEYALARTEKKIGKGYNGFVFYYNENITLEEDLARRDLTINAIAYDEENNLYIDPFNGINDLKNKILRHVGPSFVEDPLRVLRVARFRARYNFIINKDTFLLMSNIVENHEIESLSKERIYKEFSLGLMEEYPHLMLESLQACKALFVLSRVLDEELNRNKQIFDCLKIMKEYNYSLDLRFAIISINFNSIENVIAYCKNLNIPKKITKLCIQSYKYKFQILSINKLNREDILNLLLGLDFFRNKKIMENILILIDIFSKFYLKKNFFSKDKWLELIGAFNSKKIKLDYAELSHSQIALKIREERLKIIGSQLNN